MKPRKRLRIAYTPDSDDAFYYDALETGQVSLPGYELEFHRQPLSILNRAAGEGFHEVTAISSVVYPQIAERYAILSVGTSVGRGYGPVLVSREPLTLEDLAGLRIGVGGIPTTGWFLLRHFCPKALPIEMPFDRIADAVAAGELEAGVMIHEELLYYPQLGLHRVVDLGAEWCRRNDLPLPVGLNVIRRDLGIPAMQRICTAIRRSLLHGLEHPRETLGRVCRFGRGAEGQCTNQFVAMFANEDSVCMPPDVRKGLRTLLGQVADLGLCDRVPDIDIIEGTPQRVPQAA
ncbi:MAG TPA: MqnA/MqnD/SBP family protein [Gemmataceae bacterium]|nr:MqnA/MqnD/SBP family protein [Gemmataceae bacterium]